MTRRPYNIIVPLSILALCMLAIPAARSLGDTALADAGDSLDSSASTTEVSMPADVDSATTTAPALIVSTDTSVTDAASSTPADATSTPVDATSTPATTAPPSDSADTFSPPPQTAPSAPAALPQPKGALPQGNDFSLNAQGVAVLVRFSPGLTVITQDWSGAFKKPSQVATTTAQKGSSLTSAVFFGPGTAVALSGNIRLEFDGRAASSTPVAVAPDGTVTPITAACWSGPGQASRDLFLTYSGGDCATTWGNNLIVITSHTGTFGLVEKNQ